MDYSKVKYVKPSVDGIDITKDKVYEFDFYDDDFGHITDDDDFQITIIIPECAHLNGANWIPCTKDGTPL